MPRLSNATKFTTDFKDLAIIGKGTADGQPAVVFNYKQGGMIPIVVFDETEQDRIYKEYVKLFDEYLQEEK